MSTRTFLHLTARHKYSITISVLICAIIGLMTGMRLASINRFDGSIFIDFSIQDKNRQSSTFENLEAADQITESIQGWVKDSSFQNSVSASAQQYFSLQAKRQEKNNLIINFTTTTEQQARFYGETVVKELQTRLQEYNDNSDLVIFANNQPIQIKPKMDLAGLYTAFGAILGLLLTTCFVWIGEKIFPKKP